MPQRQPPLASLRAFEAVARTGSVRRAAAELFVTPGAISQQVKALEADLGVTLMRRRGNALELTEEAQRGRHRLSDGFRQIAEAAESMRALPRRKLLRLTLEPAFAANWLITRLPAYRALPDVADLLLDPTKALVDIAAGEADMGIRLGTGAYPGLEAVRLFEDEIFPVCSPKLLKGRHGLKRPQDLRNFTLLRLDWASRWAPWPDWAAWLQTAGAGDVPADQGPVFNDTGLLLRSAMDGQGVALGQSSLVKDLIRGKQLVAPFARRLKTGFCYYLVYAQGADARPEVRRFRDWLVAEAGKE